MKCSAQKEKGMGQTNKNRMGLIDYFLSAIALLCAIAALCPFSVYKSIGDRIASDGNLERLTPQVCLGMRTVFAVFFLIFSALVLWQRFDAAGRKRFFVSVRNLPGRCFRDMPLFFRDLSHAVKPSGLSFWLMLVVFAAGSLIRCLQINTPLLHDEAYSMAVWGRSDLLFAISDYHLPNNHVFHSFLINLIYHHLGKSPALLRLPVFLSGCLLIPAVWLLGRAFYNEFIAAAAAGLTAFAPFLIFYSVNARGYEIQALFSVISLGLAVYAKRKQNIFAWLLLILFSALNFFTLPIALYPFGAICVWLFLNVVFYREDRAVWRSRWQLLKYLLVMGVCVSLLSMLLYVPLLRYSGWDSFFGNIYIGGTEAATFGETMISRIRDNVQEFAGTWPLIVVYAVALGLLLSLFVYRKNAREHVSFGISMLLWMGLLIPFQRPNLWPRTLLFLHPLLLLFAASGLSGLRLIPRMRLASGVICAAIIIAAGVSQLKIENRTGADERAVQLVAEREGKNASDIHFVTAAQDNAPIWMYADMYGMPWKIFDNRESFNTVYAFVNPQNDSYLGPQTLEDLLERYGPGDVFLIKNSEEILMNESDGILYRFEGNESAIRKAYGTYPGN